jgi:hypothetical protein
MNSIHCIHEFFTAIQKGNGMTAAKALLAYPELHYLGTKEPTQTNQIH